MKLNIEVRRIVKMKQLWMSCQKRNGIFILKRRKFNIDNNPKSAKMNLIANIVHVIAIVGLLIFLWIGLIQRWNDGIHNYFNLILLVIFTVLSFIRFLKLNFRNKN